MKKKVRKFISLLLSVMMVFSALPIHAFALESDRVKEAAPDAELSGTALLESIGDKNKNFFDPSDSELVQYVPDSSTNPSLVCSAEKFREQYVPYRKPTDILINDFHFSAEEAQAILNGTSTDSRIAYIGSESDLASRFNYSRGAEIVIITQDFEITKSISMDYPFPLCTFLAAEPKIISAKDRETYTKLIFGQEREYPLSDNTTLRFSNVIMDGVSLDFNASNELHGSYDPEKWPEETNSALVEGACTINTNHCIPAMEGLGTLSFLGCTAITAGTGINVGLNKEPVFATDCNLFTYGDNVYRGLSCFLLDGSIEISHSYITNGVEIKPFSDNTSTTNTVRAIGRNSIIKGYSTLYDTDVLLENVAVQSQDCSWCFSSRELGGNLNFNTNATVLSMEQVFDEPTGIRKAKAKAEEIPGYVEHKYLLKLQYKDGTIKEEVISLYSEKSS